MKKRLVVMSQSALRVFAFRGRFQAQSMMLVQQSLDDLLPLNVIEATSGLISPANAVDHDRQSSGDPRDTSGRLV
jgi:hypothetical protein